MKLEYATKRLTREKKEELILGRVKAKKKDEKLSRKKLPKIKK